MNLTDLKLGVKTFVATGSAKFGQKKVNLAVLNAVLSNAINLTYTELLALAYTAVAEDLGQDEQALDTATKELIKAKLSKALAEKNVVASRVEVNLVSEGMKDAGLTAKSAKKIAKKLQK